MLQGKTSLLAASVLSAIAVKAQVPTITVPFSALATGFEPDNTNFYYSKSTPLLLANDGGAATGGFRVFDTASNLTEFAHQTTGRSKIVTPVYDVAGKDYFLTIAATDSILRVFETDGETELKDSGKYVLGDWSALCTWRSDKTDEKYAFLFGKRQVRQFVVREEEGDVQIVEVQTFPIPIEGEFCAISKTGIVYFSGEDAPLFSFQAQDSTDVPSVQTVLNGTDVFGIATYTGAQANYVVVGEEAGLSFYTESLEQIGSVVLSGVEELEVQGGLSILQQDTQAYPEGALALAVEGDDVTGVGLVSLEGIITAFELASNTGFDPSAPTCTDCESALSDVCSGNGYTVVRNGTACQCLVGFAGPTCADITCADDCSANGECTGPNVCTCSAGWAGPSCSFRLVSPAYETDANGGDGDDPAVWIHPTDRSLSKIITTTKSGESLGLAVFTLQGEFVQNILAGEPNNVDVIYNFPIGPNRTIDLAYAACRTDDTLCFFGISPNGTLSNISGGSQPTPDDYTVYGSCTYYSPRTQTHYVFVNSKEATYLQYKLGSSNGTLTTELVRTFTGGSGGQVEGCVADSQTGFLFLGEELNGIWRYPAEPDGGDEGVQIAATGDGILSADVEGITLVPGKTLDDGYVIVSSQGISAYVVYERKPPHNYVTTFTLGTSEDGSIDAVSNTDGIAAVGTNLGPGFEGGLFVTHDDANQLAEGGTAETASFKIAGVNEVLGEALAAKVDNDYDPRKH